MRVTHKPNILALNFTHPNKDEKNLVDLVVPLGVLPGQEMSSSSSGAGGSWGSLSLGLGWLWLRGFWGGLAVTTCKRKGGREVPVPSSACQATGESSSLVSAWRTQGCLIEGDGLGLRFVVVAQLPCGPGVTCLFFPC